MKKLLLFLLLASPAWAGPNDKPLLRIGLYTNSYADPQTHTFPALDTNNAFTGNNTHSGTETFTGAVGMTNAGVFTNTQMNNPFTTNINGLNFLTEYQAGQGANFLTSGFVAGLAVPVGSTVQGASAGSFFATNSSTGTNALAVYGQARALVNNSNNWGGNLICTDSGILTAGLSCIGLEVDVGQQSPSTAYSGLFGVTAVLGGNGAAGTVSGSTAFLASGNAANRIWANGFATANGRAQIGLNLGALATVGTVNAQGIQFTGLTGGVAKSSLITGDNAGNILIAPLSGLAMQVNGYTSTPEQAAPGALGAGFEQMWGDSTAHRWKLINNGGAAKTYAFLESDTFTTPTLSGVTNGTGLQLFNSSTTCTTGASIGATCTTAAITLPVAEADTSYRVVCIAKPALTAVPVVIATTNSSASQFTITIAALTAVAASAASYDCMAGHN